MLKGWKGKTNKNKFISSNRQKLMKKICTLGLYRVKLLSKSNCTNLQVHVGKIIKIKKSDAQVRRVNTFHTLQLFVKDLQTSDFVWKDPRDF
jgi:hypothetical protein